MTTFTLADWPILGDWVQMRNTRAAGRRDAGAVDVEGSVDSVEDRRLNLAGKARAGPACSGRAGDRECSRMRKNWEAAIGPFVVNPQPGDILQKAGDKRGLARGYLTRREWKLAAAKERLE